MQAVLITAYQDIDLLKLLCSEITKRDMLCFLHIDTKMNLTGTQRKEIEEKAAYISSKYKIHWGSYNHLLAILDLVAAAIENPDIEYIHIISGQDFPTKSKTYFEKKFANSEKIYMSVTDRNSLQPLFIDRFERYHIFTNRNIRNKFINKLARTSVKIQKLFSIKKRKIGEFDKIYKGMIWVSLPNCAAEYVMRYIKKHKEFLTQLKYCHVPEEIFFQTILMNSPYAKDIVQNNLRYTCWEMRNGSFPAVLDEADYMKIENSSSIFARKLSTLHSKNLIKKLICT